jgi:hypothetical protein
MYTYETFERGVTPAGSLVVRFYHSGDEVRAYIRELEDEETGDTIFPGEELEPKVAMRLAENKRQHDPALPIYIELTEGVEWDPAWTDQS